MPLRIVKLLGILFVGSVLACAQTPETRVCTDLSGKFVLRCPQDKPQSDSVTVPTAEDTRPAALRRSEAPPPISRVPVSATTVSTPASGPAIVGAAAVRVRPAETIERSSSLERSFARNFVLDQKTIWTSPF